MYIETSNSFTINFYWMPFFSINVGDNGMFYYLQRIRSPEIKFIFVFILNQRKKKKIKNKNSICISTAKSAYF